MQEDVTTHTIEVYDRKETRVRRVRKIQQRGQREVRHATLGAVQHGAAVLAMMPMRAGHAGHAGDRIERLAPEARVLQVNEVLTNLHCGMAKYHSFSCKGFATEPLALPIILCRRGLFIL